MINENEWHNGNLLVGDVLEKIKEIPDKSVDLTVTSPPYWGLRDYGTGRWLDGNNPDCEHKSVRRKTRQERGGLSELQEGNEGGFGDESKWTDDKCPDCNAHYEDPQWGSEMHFEDYLAKMMKLMTEIKRILKDSGTCWINLGDTYSTQSGGMRDMAQGKRNDYGKINYEKNKDYADSLRIIQPKMHLKPKTRVGIPERFYIRCIDDGWIARNHIPWIKANAMPTSVKDRFQNKWESIFFFAKQGKYYFNLDAVREKTISDPYPDFNRRVRDAKKYDQLGLDHSPTKAIASEEEKGNYQPVGRSNFGTGNDIKRHMEESQRKMFEVPGQSTQGIHRNRAEGKEDWEYESTEGEPKGLTSIKQRQAYSRNVLGLDHDACLNDPKGKNPGDVFNINPKPFIEAHFATFPIELPTKIIKCACPAQVCNKCGKPREKKYQSLSTKDYSKDSNYKRHIDPKHGQAALSRNSYEFDNVEYKDLGLSDCGCNAGFSGGVVFDPFMGSGTVALAALNLNRKWLGIEINPEYVKIIRKRLLPKHNVSMDSFV